MTSMRWLGASVLALWAVGCSSAKRTEPCPAFDEAQRKLDELTGQVLDPTFQDPRFAAAAELFEAVPAACPRAERAVLMAESIRQAQAERAATPPPPPPPRASAVRSVAARPPPAAPPPASPKVEPPATEPTATGGVDCGKLVDKARRECPLACRKKSPGAPKGACVDACEDMLAKLVNEAKCPAVPRLPKQYKPPDRPQAKPSEDGKTLTYCAYFYSSGGGRRSFCTDAPLSEAQKDCDAKLKKQNIEGTCACTDDATFIGGRCN